VKSFRALFEFLLSPRPRPVEAESESSLFSFLVAAISGRLWLVCYCPVICVLAL